MGELDLSLDPQLEKKHHYHHDRSITTMLEEALHRAASKR